MPGFYKCHKTYNFFFKYVEVVFDIFDHFIEFFFSTIFRCESWKFVNQFVDYARCIWNAIIYNDILFNLVFLNTRFESRSDNCFFIHLRVPISDYDSGAKDLWSKSNHLFPYKPFLLVFSKSNLNKSTQVHTFEIEKFKYLFFA